MELQERVTHGWDISAEGFSKHVVAEEFDDPGRSVWTELILSMAPKEGPLDILDAGTGPGLFAIILAMAGHRTTGIDISSKMLAQAKENAARMGVAPTFRMMNSQNPDFLDNSFDLIVSRNVMWTIVEPEEAYENWFRCLKPGGRVIVFDQGHRAGEQGARTILSYDEKNLEYLEKFGELPPMSYTRETYEEARGFKRDLKLTYADRPCWDMEMMKTLGYTNIRCEDVVSQVSYNAKKALLHKDSEFFRLCGDKPLKS